MNFRILFVALIFASVTASAEVSKSNFKEGSTAWVAANWGEEHERYKNLLIKKHSSLVKLVRESYLSRPETVANQSEEEQKKFGNTLNITMKAWQTNWKNSKKHGLNIIVLNAI